MDWLFFSQVGFKEKRISVPNISLTLDDKISKIAQEPCFICKETKEKIATIPIKMKPVSNQCLGTTKKCLIKAFKEWNENKNIYFEKGKKICIKIVYVYSRDKDLDNMTKALLDGLKTNIIYDDMDIEHLNCMKIFIPENEDYIIIHIRESKLNNHSDVIFNKINHKWFTKSINLDDYLDD